MEKDYTKIVQLTTSLEVGAILMVMQRGSYQGHKLERKILIPYD